jgi:type IV pilus secretin PilQ/predicted competence protein
MRGKQLLGILLMVPVLSTMAAAAGPQLTAVSVSTQDTTTTITIRASGAFTHTEYRPSDNLLLVDLPGVSAGVLEGQSQSVQGPVAGYRVQSFQGTGGTDVARLELTLRDAPFVTFNQNQGVLEVRVTATQTAAASAAAPAAPDKAEVSATPDPTPAAPAPPASQTVQGGQSQETTEVAPHQSAKMNRPAWVRSVNVIHGRQGIELEIRGNGELKPTVTRVTDPERLVVDLENARTLRPVQVRVKSDDVKDVRMAQYQVNPPITRVVVDLEAARDYELVPSEQGLRVKLHAPAQVASLGAPPVPPPATQTMPALPKAPLVASEPVTHDSIPHPPTEVANAPREPAREVASAMPPTNPAAVNQSASGGAQDFVIVQPTYKPKAQADEVVASESVTHDSTPQPPTEVANAPREPAREVASAMPPANPAAATQSASGGAQDFVIVQPTYKPKAQADEPGARAAEAAAKFSGGKTEVAVSRTPALPGAEASLHAAAPVSAAQQPAAPPAMSMTGKPKYTGEPISVNLKDVDLKDFFRLIHEISGLNVVLDPSVHGTLTLVLDDVPWDQALDIVLKNNGLERELDGNVLRIATVDTLKNEATSRREQVEAQALAASRITVTRFLSYAHSKDVVPTIKKFLSKRGEIVSDDRTNALIMMDIPQVFPEIDRLLTQLDRKTPEVEIEARVVAATRNFARDIGVQLGFGWGNRSTAAGGAGSVGQSPLTSGYVAPPPYFTSPVVPAPTSGTPTTTSASIPLFSNLPAVGPTSGISLLNLGSTYRLDAILTAAESRGLLKILSRPRVITQNNIQAIVRQGVQIPVVTAAQLGGPPTVTYVAAFLRLTVTPQITIENTIFMNVDVENTTPDFSQAVNGNPALLTQQALTQVLVSDGGTVVIGGVISTKNSLTIDQVPLLGSIPALGNLFKHRLVNTETQELFFFITPKIIQT